MFLFRRLPFSLFSHAEQPPSCRILDASSGLALEVYLHRVAGGGEDFVPVLADVHLGASVMARPGLAPGADHGRDLDRLAPPQELARETRLARRHMRRVYRGDYRLERLAYEPLADVFRGHLIRPINRAATK